VRPQDAQRDDRRGRARGQRDGGGRRRGQGLPEDGDLPEERPGFRPREDEPEQLIRPERKVASTSPSMPWRATVAETSTMKAPAGPPIWKREPPSAETRKPPTMAVTRP
jgi:hypothetical protein